jgi:lysyl-tRNA synthetase class 2
MGAWHSGIRYSGRILEIQDKDLRLQMRLLLGDRIVDFTADGAHTPALSSGDLIEFTLAHVGITSGELQIENVVRFGGPLPGRPWRQGDALRWRRPGIVPSRMALLKLRQDVIRVVRNYFDTQGFLEVDTPVRVSAPSPEPQFQPVSADGNFLITSPEFQLKRLLVGGADRLFRIGPAFRGGEQGNLHNPEFTILEWYRAHAEAESLADDLQSLLLALGPVAKTFVKTNPVQASDGAFRFSALRVRQPLLKRSVADLFLEYLKMDIKGITETVELIAAARAAQWPHMSDLPNDFDGAFSRLWIDIEAQFPPEPFLVVDWPAPLASLARLNPSNPTVAERIELYAGGMELANGFSELTDPQEQRRRFEGNLAQRKALGLPSLPLDEKFLAALADGMPPSAGMALGIDRLVMLISGVRDIRDVLSFASDEL